MIDDKRIPVTILTGYLGSGKTSIINNLIKHTFKKIGIIINEVGEIDIDGETISKNTDEIIKFSDRCMCCAVRGDIIKSIKELISLHNPDYILIETSGLAHPLPIAMSLREDEISDKVRIDAVICVIDSLNMLSQFENDNMIDEQIESSDIVVINKLENAQANLKLILEHIVHINPNTPILESPNATVDERILFSSNLFNQDKQELNTDHNHDTFATKSFYFHGNFNKLKFKAFIKQLSKEIYRAKGFINLNKKYYLFNKVGVKLDLEIISNSNHYENRLVFIGRDLKELEEQYKSFIS